MAPYDIYPLVLACFIWHSVFKIHSRRNRCPNCALFFMAECYSAAWIRYTLFFQSSVDGHLGCFHLVATMSRAADLSLPITSPCFIFFNRTYHRIKLIFSLIYISSPHPPPKSQSAGTENLFLHHFFSNLAIPAQGQAYSRYSKYLFIGWMEKTTVKCRAWAGDHTC